MKPILIITGTLLLAIIVSTYGLPNAGHITLTVADWTIQTSLNFFIISILILLFLSYKLLQLFSNALKLPNKVQNWQKNRTAELAKKHREAGLIALFSYNWQNAQNALKKSVKLNNPATIDHLAAAQVAQKLDDIEARDQHLKIAQQIASHNIKTDITLITALLEKEQQQTTKAITTLDQLTGKKFRHKQSKTILLELYQEIKNWSMVLKLLPQTNLTKEKKHHIQKQIYIKQLQQLHIDHQPLEPTTLIDCWKNIPLSIRKTPELIASYTTETLKISNAENCIPLIEKLLKKQWNSELIRLYGLINGKNIGKQLAFAESLLSDHQQDSVLALTIGRLSIKNKLWGKSKANLKKSLFLQPCPETYQLLGHVLEELGEHQAALKHYKQGLELAAHSNTSE